VSILQTTLPKDASEVVTYLFDFTTFPEYKAGETLSAPAVPGVAGLTVGTPAVTAVAYAEGGVAVAAGGAVAVAVSGGTAGTTYDLECSVAFSGGNTRVVKGRLAVE
jgi:hypothetical protein